MILHKNCKFKGHFVFFFFFFFKLFKPNFHYRHWIFQSCPKNILTHKMLIYIFSIFFNIYMKRWNDQQEIFCLILMSVSTAKVSDFVSLNFIFLKNLLMHRNGRLVLQYCNGNYSPKSVKHFLNSSLKIMKRIWMYEMHYLSLGWHCYNWTFCLSLFYCQISYRSFNTKEFPFYSHKVAANL